MRIEGEKRKGYPERAKPILRSQIEDAIRHTLSNSAAAKYLGVDIARYKKYASIYGLYEQHNNKRGIGTSKGYAKTGKSISLNKIFNNEYPKYSLHRLKTRMIRKRLLEEKCYLCGFSEKRFGDGRTPLLLTFKDKFRDFTRSNIHLLCYNCMFLTTGAPQVAHQFHIESSLKKEQAGEEDTTSYPYDYVRPDGHVDDDEIIDGAIPEDLGFDVAKFQNELLKDLKNEE